MESTLIDAYIGIGSNVGSRRENCLLAVKMLDGEEPDDREPDDREPDGEEPDGEESDDKEFSGISGIKVLAVSSMHETKPWGITDQRDFINLCVKVGTTLSPRELLAGLKRIEEIIGRKETYRWGPRVIDLDILLYGGEIIHSDDGGILDGGALIIPHPHMHERLFVLKPLCEIAPEARHPALGMTVREMLDNVAL
jgi:2-amino-4-hydroxy-6-hydroxymethyldihydropteridine diphosphokinase